jgi:hypothetical protein
VSRATFNVLAQYPTAVYQMQRSELVRALSWNDPNGDYNEPQGEPGHLTLDHLRLALLCQVIDSIERK